ncbi:hypothetical protein BTO06_00905 [Tenacibaculum sp. SZ-18]|nr:hypothetical protein BTO06_00905 [Tenacibaculum sp. SZ-18]
MSAKKPKLPKVHEKVHFFNTLHMKKKYSIGFYTGGVKVDNWKNLSEEQKKEALSEDWYLRWSYRNPDTGKLERQTNFKGGVNYFKTKTERIDFLNQSKRALKQLLDSGYTPQDLKSKLEDSKENFQEVAYSVKKALDFAYDIAKNLVGDSTLKGYRSYKNKFLDFIGEENQLKEITWVDKKIVLKFLNHVLNETSPRTRNNARTDLSALFGILEKQEIIEENFIKSIHKEDAKSKTDRRFTDKQLLEITNAVRKNNIALLLVLKFVSYNFLRPIEVCRLKVKDVDLDQGLLFFKAKNKPTKVKRIPSVLLEELRSGNFNTYPGDYSLVSMNGKPGVWQIKPESKRDYFTKIFKEIKDELGLDSKFGMYSFRHSYITNLFRYLRTTKDLSYNQAVDALMPITGHDSKEGLKNYLHKIDADIPKDWSGMIEIVF